MNDVPSMSKIATRAVGAAIVVALAGCTGIRIVSSYDDATGKGLTTLQANTDDFIAKLSKDAPSQKNAFDQHQVFYEETDQQLRRLEFRVGSIPNNGQTVKLVSDVRSVLLGKGACDESATSLRDLHCIPANRAHGPSKRSLAIAARQINQTIGEALALEIAKKQGTESNK